MIIPLSYIYKKIDIGWNIMSLLYLKKVVHSSTRQILRKKNISQKLSLKKSFSSLLFKTVNLSFQGEHCPRIFRWNTVHEVNKKSSEKIHIRTWIHPRDPLLAMTCWPQPGGINFSRSTKRSCVQEYSIYPRELSGGQYPCLWRRLTQA